MDSRTSEEELLGGMEGDDPWTRTRARRSSVRGGRTHLSGATSHPAVLDDGDAPSPAEAVAARCTAATTATTPATATATTSAVPAASATRCGGCGLGLKSTKEMRDDMELRCPPFSSSPEPDALSALSFDSPSSDESDDAVLGNDEADATDPAEEAESERGY